jgi:hypothetical protein
VTQGTRDNETMIEAAGNATVALFVRFYETHTIPHDLSRTAVGLRPCRMGCAPTILFLTVFRGL